MVKSDESICDLFEFFEEIAFKQGEIEAFVWGDKHNRTKTEL